MFEFLINKKVKVVMRDGYLKFGILKRVESNFIEVEYFNGKKEIINLEYVKSLTEFE